MQIVTRKTSFSVSYGMEAMVPVELCMSSARRIGYDEQQNGESMNASLDLL